MYKLLHVVLSSVLSAGLAAGAVGLGSKYMGAHETVATSSAHGEEKVHETHWGYEGEGAPENWADLSEDNYMCAEGDMQSPIDLDDEYYSANHPKMKLKYKSTKIDIVNNGHTVQYNYDSGSYLAVGGKKFEVLQFHFHATSEHTVHGLSYPLEMHIVHKADDGSLAVVGLLMRTGKENKTLKTAKWDHIPTEEGETFTNAATFNIGKMLPKSSTWRYGGSLTTPPCSEGVAWHVFRKAITVSEEQLETFTDLYDANFRPTQGEGGAYAFAD